MSDGIEIHFDEKRGYLELACEPDAFAPYREFARTQLVDIPDVSLDKVIEIHIVDTATFVARRDAPRRRLWDWGTGTAERGQHSRKGTFIFSGNDECPLSEARAERPCNSNADHRPAER